jgi:solute carrier family 25 (adenine nucleotide translocator) protein 4/5/6/31
VYKNQGPVSFWRGNQVEVAKVLPYEYLHLTMPSIFRKFVVKADPIKEKKKYYIQSTLAGALATFTFMIYLYPLDVLRVRVGTDVGYRKEREFRGSIHCLR